MGAVKHLENKAAIDKMKELVESIRVCMFCTTAQGIPFETRPMATSRVDEDGDLWFLSAIESYKNQEIKSDEHVQLVYANPGSSEFMTVEGYAEIIKDQQVIDELWTPIAKAWFTNGKDDPRITAIRVRPERAYYWDTQHGKMVSLFKIAVAALSGRSMDDGIEGVLDI